MVEQMVQRFPAPIWCSLTLPRNPIPSQPIGLRASTICVLHSTRRRPVRQVAKPVKRQTTLFGRVRQVAAPGRSLLTIVLKNLKSISISKIR